MHPTHILFADSPAPTVLPSVEHYAGNPRFIAKALAKQHTLNGAFDITLDLEDGASIGQEAEQAHYFGTLLSSSDNRHQRLGVRLHDPDHPHFEADITHVLAAGHTPAYWMLPKITGLNQAQQAIALLTHHQQRLGISSAPVHLLIETHGALHQAYELAALPQVQSLSFGLMDFVSAHHGAIPAEAMTSPLQFDHPMVAYAKLAISRACAAHGKIANHNVTTDYQTTGAAYADALRARNEFGYQRMWSIHPNQIDEILQAFTPDTAQIHTAAQLLQTAAAADWGPIAFAGKLHDRASYRHYWLILQRAHAANIHLPPEIQTWFENQSR